MFSSSLNQAFEAATPQACKALIASGVKFVVAVETAAGEWFLAHAEDQSNANNIAHTWVDQMSARGASLWRLLEDGPASKPFGTVYAQSDWEG